MGKYTLIGHNVWWSMYDYSARANLIVKSSLVPAIFLHNPTWNYLFLQKLYELNPRNRKKMYSVDRRKGLRWQRESAGNAHTAQTVNIFLTFFRLLRHMGQAPTSSAILQCKKCTPYHIPLIPKKLHSNMCSKNTSDFSSFPYPWWVSTGMFEVMTVKFKWNPPIPDSYHQQLRQFISTLFHR